MFREPVVLSLQCLTAIGKRTKTWAVTRGEIGPPLSLGIRFDVAGTGDLQSAEQVQRNCFLIYSSNDPLGINTEIHQSAPSSRRTGRIKLRRGRSTSRPSRVPWTADSCLESCSRIDWSCRKVWGSTPCNNCWAWSTKGSKWPRKGRSCKKRCRRLITSLRHRGETNRGITGWSVHEMLHAAD